ncbi:unnamed protein product [Orchesella dallaii]|uniref:Uncharacterized protein n=1 Tax=Orchesella dallaii TaxID=48710 RepID=A0ABP1QWW2_9HEXA
MTLLPKGVALIILLKLSVLESLIIRRYYHDGILYDDFAADSDNIRYTTTEGEGWDNLETLAQTQGLSGKAMFCTRGPGSWLLYQGTMFSFGTGRNIKLLSGEHCVPVDNIQSIQPLAVITPTVGNTHAIVHFEEKYFGSRGQIFRNGTGNAKVGSAIFLGLGNWTVTVGGKAMCVAMLGLDGDVCLLEDVNAAFGAHGEAGDVSMEEGCKEGEPMYHLQSCYGLGLHSITYEFDFSLPQMTQLCSASAYEESNQAHQKFLNVLKIWNFRTDPDPEGDLKFPETIPNGPQRLSVLWNMIKIMGITCPALSVEYLQTLKQIYLMHIQFGEIWMNETTADGTRLEQNHRRWLQAQAFIADCTHQVTADAGEKEGVPLPPLAEGDGHFKVFSVGCAPEDVSNMKSDVEEDAMESFLMGESFDFVIEQIWLMLNYISPYCNHMIGFKNNYWSEFPLLFKRDFLYPVREQWRDPGVWSTFYPLMFSGFDMEKERKYMISCVQHVLMETPFYDPLARPKGFFNGTFKDGPTSGAGNTTVPAAPAPATDDSDKKTGKRQLSLVDIEAEKRNAQGKLVSKTDVKKATTTTTTTTTSKPVKGSVVAVKEVVSKVVVEDENHSASKIPQGSAPITNPVDESHGQRTKKKKGKHSKKGGKRRSKLLKKTLKSDD